MRQTFNDSLQAREWEHKVLRRLGVIRDEKWLNQTDNKMIVLTEESLNKIRLARKNQILSAHQIRILQTANLGKRFSTDHKNKISRSLKNRSFSEIHKKNLSIAKKRKALVRRYQKENERIKTTVRSAVHIKEDDLSCFDLF